MKAPLPAENMMGTVPPAKVQLSDGNEKPVGPKVAVRAVKLTDTEGGLNVPDCPNWLVGVVPKPVSPMMNVPTLAATTSGGVSGPYR